MVVFAEQLATRSTRRTLQIAAVVGAIGAVAFAAAESAATRVISTALLAALTLVALKVALVSNTRPTAPVPLHDADKLRGLQQQQNGTDQRLGRLETTFETLTEQNIQAQQRAESLMERLDSADMLLRRTEPVAAQTAELKNQVIYINEVVDRLQRELGSGTAPPS